ncbi:uncharacterized protein LOC114648993 isoform X2 [Erpetoichthys calabaricus]|uniref:uncharacterized protein LOC114648993 isoform X2 n=1 Tax=Erpetoichthys calabaricus TaxID=27687 RepID=UPI0010A00D7C|nr:uncharacterized protein LOC114648993 isoform X2 [Erpetoichthys calabaricus]
METKCDDVTLFESLCDETSGSGPQCSAVENRTIFPSKKFKTSRRGKKRPRRIVPQATEDDAGKRSVKRKKGPVSIQSPRSVTQDAGETSPNLGDLVLAAELMELVSETVRGVQMGVWFRHGFENDHASYPLPPDPIALSGLVQNLAKKLHKQEEALCNLQAVLENKEKQFKQSKDKLEWELQTLTTARETRIDALENEVARLVLENSLAYRELRKAQEEAASSADSVLQLGTQLQEKRFHARSTIISAQVLRKDPKWLRFYTGFESYEKFFAFLRFLKNGDGSGLCYRRETESEAGEASDGEEEEFEDMDKESEEIDIFSDEYMAKLEPISHSVAQQTQEDTNSNASLGLPKSQEDTTIRGMILNRKSVGGAPNLLCPEDQLLLVLMRLRLGLLLQDLAFRFRVAESTASRIWVHWINLLQERLQQIPVKCTSRYVDSFQPKYTSLLADGQTLIVMECADLLFDVPTKERHRTAGSGVGSTSFSQPYRALSSKRGCMVASPLGYLGFASDLRLDKWKATVEVNTKLALPPFLDRVPPESAIQQGLCREVLSVRSLTDKVLMFRFLRCVHPISSAALLDRAWEVCCYLACLLHEPMGLK